jgi:Ran GTPase-activating protein (RanGAP) involved in mRNA processing and transport
LTSLNLFSNQIGPTGAQALATTLLTNHGLTSLDLSGNRIGPVGAQALATALLTNHGLTSLDLSGNQIEPVGFQALANVIDTRLKTSHQQQTTVQSEYLCEQSFLSELPRDGCILYDILNYAKIPPLKIIHD